MTAEVAAEVVVGSTKRVGEDASGRALRALAATLQRWDRVYDTEHGAHLGRVMERPPPVFLSERRVCPGPVPSGCSLYRYVRDLPETRRLVSEKISKIMHAEPEAEAREIALQMTLLVHSAFGCILSPRSYLNGLPEDTQLWVSTLRFSLPRRKCGRRRAMPPSEDAIGYVHLLAEDLEERPSRDDLTEVCGVPLRGLLPSRLLDKYGFECYAVQVYRGETLRDCVQLDPMFDALPADLVSLVSVRGGIFSLDLRGNEYMYDAHVVHCMPDPIPMRFSRVYSCIERLRPALPPPPKHTPDAVAQCRVCMGAPVDMCVVPCGHPCCTQCITKCRLCPMCRGAVANVQRIFWV